MNNQDAQIQASIKKIHMDIIRRLDDVNKEYKSAKKHNGLYATMLKTHVPISDQLTLENISKLEITRFLDKQTNLANLILDIAQVLAPGFVSRSIVEKAMCYKKALKSCGFVDLYKKCHEGNLDSSDITRLFEMIPTLLDHDLKSPLMLFEEFLVFYNYRYNS